MAKFTPCVRIKRADGLYPVYIRLYHNGGVQYIKTGLLVSERGIKTVFSKQGKQRIEITDHRVLKECYTRIGVYAEKINHVGANLMDSKTLLKLLEEKDTDISFTTYAEDFIIRMCNEGRDNPAQNYRAALKSLKKFFGCDHILFKHLTTKTIESWIDSMKDSARAKSLYPACIRKIIHSAIDEYNNYDLDIIRIRVNPFAKAKIPKIHTPEKRSVDASLICKILTAGVTLPDEGIRAAEFSRDVSRLIFCLAGINAADLYDLKSSSLGGDGKLRYNRKKTRDKSGSGAYMEITVPEFIRPLFDRYRGHRDHLFIFAERAANSTVFVKSINRGLKIICKHLSIKENITTYVFRHSWATIAQNECGASTEQIAFALNHASIHKITEGYIRKDYAPIDRLNKKVMQRVFGDDEPPP
jgi:site-specific recombinase XerD